LLFAQGSPNNEPLPAITRSRNSLVNSSGRPAGNSIVLPIDSTQLLLVIPWWFIATVAALLPASTLLRAPLAVRTYRRRKRGLCTQCGYDLRFSSGRCPECGQST